MDPLTLMLIGGGVKAASGLVQTWIGHRQRKKALEGLDNLKDPQMEMPEGIEELIHLARVRAGREMPGMDRARDEFGARTSRGLDAVTRAARTSGDIMSATGDLYAEEMRNVRQLAVAGEDYTAAREGELMGALRTKGQVEQQMFNINEMMPFQRKLNQYLSDAQVGGQNIAHGVGTAVGSIGDVMSNYARIKMLQGWMGEEEDGNPDYSSQADKALLARQGYASSVMNTIGR